jgi:hypothetical protein
MLYTGLSPTYHPCGSLLRMCMVLSFGTSLLSAACALTSNPAPSSSSAEHGTDSATVHLALQLTSVVLQALVSGPSQPHADGQLSGFGLEAGVGAARDLVLSDEAEAEEEEEEAVQQQQQQQQQQWRVAMRQLAAGLLVNGRLTDLLQEPGTVASVQQALGGARCTCADSRRLAREQRTAHERDHKAEREAPTPARLPQSFGNTSGDRRGDLAVRRAEGAARVDPWWRTPNVLDHLASTVTANATTSRAQREKAHGVGGIHNDAATLLAAFEVATPDQGTWAAALTGWASAADDPREWSGVHCNPAGRVYRVDFSRLERKSQLRFALGPAVGRLDALKLLDISDTQLYGSLVEELTTLHQLDTLYVSSTSVSGTLPHTLGSLSKLRYLYVSSTSLSGTLPQTTGNLTQLQYLGLFKTFLSGTLPTVGSLRELHQLDVSSTSLSGTLPPAVGNLTELWDLVVGMAFISGTLPPTVGKLAELKHLDLTTMPMSGTLPSTVGSLTKLQRLRMDGTSFSGTLPITVGNLIELQELNVYAHLLSGTLPSTVGDLTKLRQLTVDHASLSGTLPPTVGNLVELQQLNVHTTPLSGTLPPTLGNCTELLALHMETTLLSGTLPTTVGKLSKLQNLFVHSTLLSGTLPALDSCTNLAQLDVHDCALTGLPPSLPMKQFTHLYLNRNPLDATASELAALLYGHPTLHVLDIGFFNARVVLEPNVYGEATNGERFLRSYGTRVAKPSGCVVGGFCAFRLDLYDDYDAPVHLGRVVRDLELGLGTWRVQMQDPWRNGSVLAVVSASWITRVGPRLFHFYHQGVEFQPIANADGSLTQGANCSKEQGHMGEGGCPALRTVDFVCPIHTHADAHGVCSECDTGFEHANASTAMCRRACTGGRVLHAEGEQCTCPADTYDVSARGIILCVAASVHDPASLPGYTAAMDQKHNGRMCIPCPAECATCVDGEVTLSQGWRLIADSPHQLEQMIARTTTSGGVALPQVVLRCPSAAYGSPACPALLLRPGVTKGRTCLGNHAGVLCAVCKPDFSRRSSDNSCEPCSAGTSAIRADFGLSIGSFLGFLSIVVLIIVSLGYWQRARLRWIKREVGTNLRIIIGLLQVLALLKDALSLVFPSQARHAFSYAALLCADIHSLVRFDCLGWTWESKWVISVLVIPSVAFAVVGLRWVWQRRTDAENARADMLSFLFLVVLVLYPQISSRILSALRCRQLGDGLSVLEVDYSVHCGDNGYQALRSVAIILVFLWPVGIPLGLLLLLYRQYRQSKVLWNEREMSAAATASARDEVREGLAEFHAARMARLPSVCLMEDFSPECFWYEPVDMLRKLALSGLLQFVHRGTAAQVVVGCALAFGASGLHQRLQPYRRPEANTLKALVEAQIFLTFLISFILRVLPRVAVFEPLGAEFYGWLLVVGLCGVLVAALWLSTIQVWRHRRFRVGLTTAFGNEYAHASELGLLRGTSTQESLLASTADSTAVVSGSGNASMEQRMTPED